VTRGNVIDLARENNIPIFVGDITLHDVAQADEAFVTGTFGGLTPVSSIDGRLFLPRNLPGPVTARLMALYEAAKDAEVTFVR
jgi:branched-chain amino acid aminotransferase